MWITHSQPPTSHPQLLKAHNSVWIREGGTRIPDSQTLWTSSRRFPQTKHCLHYFLQQVLQRQPCADGDTKVWWWAMDQPPTPPNTAPRRHPGKSAQGSGPPSGSDDLPLPPGIASPQTGPPSHPRPGLPSPGLEMTLLWVTGEQEPHAERDRSETC